MVVVLQRDAVGLDVAADGVPVVPDHLLAEVAGVVLHLVGGGVAVPGTQGVVVLLTEVVLLGQMGGEGDRGADDLEKG